jgi:hypothetical protein
MRFARCVPYSMHCTRNTRPCAACPRISLPCAQNPVPSAVVSATEDSNAPPCAHAPPCAEILCESQSRHHRLASLAVWHPLLNRNLTVEEMFRYIDALQLPKTK